MPFLFRCPHCETETEVEDCYAGQTGACAVCGKTITVPQAPIASRVGRSTLRQGPNVSVAIILAVTIVGLLLAGGTVALGLALFRPVLTRARHSALSGDCHQNLQRIALAMQAYAEDHGTLPPAYLADARGRPQHSWRVLLLPYLGHEATYQQYNFSESWDSPNNLALQYQMPSVYACPTDGDASSANETSYMVVVGRRTLFPDAASASLQDVPDGLANTILVVETADTATCWLQPRDLDSRTLQFQLNGDRGEIRSRHETGAHVATADGVVHLLDESISPEALRAMTTRAGGEEIPARRMTGR